MAGLILTNIVLFAIIGSIWAARGIDLKIGSSWLLGLYAFMSGFLAGFVRSDGAGGYEVTTNWNASLLAGTIFAFVFLVTGATSRWNRSRAEKYVDNAERSQKEKYEHLAETLFKDKSSG
jgi:hypothetical protein